jgi:hypothetical protein
VLSLKDIAVTVGAVVCGSLAGKLMIAMRGQRWRDSVRGLLFATALIAIALFLLVTNWQK